MTLKHIYKIKSSLYIYNITKFILNLTWNIIIKLITDTMMFYII